MPVAGRPFTLASLEKTLWALLLLTLPVTSFRFLPFFGSAQVRPLSFLPAFPLFLLVILRCFRERKFLFWNSGLPALLAFSLAILISSAWGGFQSPELYEFEYQERLLRALITFAVGLVFFLLPVALVRSDQDLRFTLKWLFIGFSGHLIWSLLQLVEIHITSTVFEGETAGNLVESIQRMFSIAGISANKRISGLALEPSWLAAQIVTLYAPWLMASILRGNVVFKRRWLIPALFVSVLVLVILAYSRSGMVVLLAACGLTILVDGVDLLKRCMTWLAAPFRASPMVKAHRTTGRLLRIGLLFLFLAALIAGFFLLNGNAYFAALWQAEPADLVDYFVTIYAGPRLAYAWTGWQIFTTHPWVGVGLGASGFYIQSSLPDWSHFNLAEISMLLSPDNTTFPNIKNMYLRLLAELGIVGFWSWMAFNFSVLAVILSMRRSPRQEVKFVATAGLFAWFAVLLSNISLDSLAMPLIWIPFGILLGLHEGSPKFSNSLQSPRGSPDA